MLKRKESLSILLFIISLVSIMLIYRNGTYTFFGNSDDNVYLNIVLVLSLLLPLFMFRGEVLSNVVVLFLGGINVIVGIWIFVLTLNFAVHRVDIVTFILFGLCQIIFSMLSLKDPSTGYKEAEYQKEIESQRVYQD